MKLSLYSATIILINMNYLKEVNRFINSNLNIIPIDYDPSASEVNQLNRIKLMLSKAFKTMESPNENSNNNINMSINEYKKYTINLEKLKVEN